ncbi:ArsA family ATPase [Janibacter sp. G368]|uniref:ArsA family ATPase n=2 Tax=unclassified Janibacter TaxID=2649294 RepID=UPI003CFE9936
MRAHLVVGGGDHGPAVASRVLAALTPHHVVARPAPDDGLPDPVVTALEDLLDRLLTALDLPSPVVADLVSRILPPELPDLLRLARQLDRAGRDGHELVLEVDLEVARLLDAPQRVARAMSAFVPVIARWEVLVAPDGVGNLPHPNPPVLTALREGAALLEALDAALADPGETTLHLAAPAGPVGAARRADAEVLLALMGRTLTAVHPEGGAGVEHLPAPAGDPGVRVERADDGSDAWRLHIGLPGVRAADLDLVRHDDELVLGCAGRSRRVLLPSVLRRCDVARAGVAHGVLTVTMTPDEAVWPRG